MIKQVMICQIFSQASQIIFLTAISEKIFIMYYFISYAVRV